MAKTVNMMVMFPTSIIQILWVSSPLCVWCWDHLSSCCHRASWLESRLGHGVSPPHGHRFPSAQPEFSIQELGRMMHLLSWCPCNTHIPGPSNDLLVTGNWVEQRAGMRWQMLSEQEKIWSTAGRSWFSWAPVETIKHWDAESPSPKKNPKHLFLNEAILVSLHVCCLVPRRNGKFHHQL